jgi:curved DNA-binding protein CbpA
MGNGQSLAGYNPSHIRIYQNLLQIRDPINRVNMIRTLFVSQEYVASARTAGIYSHLLSYVARVQGGEAPIPLPGEQPQQPQQRLTHPRATAAHPQDMIEYGVNAIRPQIQQRPSQVVAKGRRNEKALTYFQSSLQVLGLEEEVALTDDALKRAYKRAAIKAHPDKGGSEEEFEAVTRAHAYLGEILRRISGGKNTAKRMEVQTGAPAIQDTHAVARPSMTTIQESRKADTKQWETIEPVRLNPKKLDLDAFNKLFEQTRIPDPDEDGYGDWLKNEKESAAGGGPKFSGKFNRDVFNQAFEEEARKHTGAAGGGSTRQPEVLTLGSLSGVELGRGRPDSYTAAANAAMNFTDLRSAYTTDATITNQVAGIQVEARSFDQYSSQWKQAPKPLTEQERLAVEAAERAEEEREQHRQLRAKQEDSVANQYFERMKRLVVHNGKPVG